MEQFKTIEFQKLMEGNMERLKAKKARLKAFETVERVEDIGTVSGLLIEKPIQISTEVITKKGWIFL